MHSTNAYTFDDSVMLSKHTPLFSNNFNAISYTSKLTFWCYSFSALFSVS